MTVFFTADLHLGHGNIIKHTGRPFLSPDEQTSLAAGLLSKIAPASIARMNSALIDEINSVVGPNDTLWVLGDFTLDKLEEAQRFRDRIICRDLRLVWGNHDRGSIAPLFTETHDLVKVRVNGQKIVLCHYAMATWDGAHKGTWHLYGHSHANAEAWLDAAMPGRRSMDVGVDNIARLTGRFRPVSFEEIAEWIGSRDGHSIDHHGHTAQPLLPPGEDVAQ
jgi:calcineurin-like phosphoesterase family protein